jgi:2-amino-4-hydroxy-6-hydroxymethyldihydropteridine diphosphokinase
MGEALRILAADPRTELISVSSLYSTPPWGKLDQPDFLNAAAELVTSHEPKEFLELCLDAERRLKRERKERWGPRLIDIDILIYGDRTIDEPGLEVPHPRMRERAFVLVPLSEIAPDLQIEGVPIARLLEVLDSAGIHRRDLGRDWWH